VLKLPHKLPGKHVSAPGVVTISDQDVGGYDLMVGGHGFRLATDQQFAYVRGSEPTTTHRFDSESEPGEQSLSALPWIKSQSSFHGGAGQLNLEQGLTSFEYQQEKVDHIRFDTSLGVDPWSLGKVTRLPDCRRFNPGFSITCSATATVGGLDYAVLGGPGGLYQAVWSSGPDADPTVTRIDLTGSTFLSNANCTVSSLCTDGANYYGVVQMTAVGFQYDTLTYVIRGQFNSTATPTAIYKGANLLSLPNRHNLCINPSFETNATSWNTVSATIARSTLHHNGVWSDINLLTPPETACGLATATATGGFGCSINFSASIGAIYTASVYVYVPSGNPDVTVTATTGTGTQNGTSTSVKDTWTRLSVTFTATGGTCAVNVVTATSAIGNQIFVDDCLIEQTPTLQLYFDGARYDDPGISLASWDGTAHASASTAVYSQTPGQLTGVVGWQKARLVAGLGASFYELSASAGSQTALPSPKYTAPIPAWVFTAISESPTGVLAAGAGGNKSSILEFTLDSSGATPILTGGATVAQLPVGEQVLVMEAVVGSWLAIGTSRGLRIGTFDTYTGRLKIGPISVTTTASCLDVAARDRFVYGGFTNQQADGTTGLVRLDLSMQVDVAGRLAYAPDLRPPTSAPTGQGTVYVVDVLPLSGRMMFITPEGLHVEGNGPGTDGVAWLRTSRIRYNTAEMKLFKLGRVHGALNVANIQVTGIAPYGVSQNLGTFGFLNSTDPGEFRLVGGTNEWLQLQFAITGTGGILNSYQVKAYPAPSRQHIITLTANCFSNEVDRFGLDVTDPQTPRVRWQNLVDLEAAGNEIRYVEFTNQGSTAQLVVIDQLEFKSFSRPNIEDDFGGYITMRLRTTEN
jgi:hypothetical protein